MEYDKTKFMRLTTTVEVVYNGQKYATERWVDIPDDVLKGLSDEDAVLLVRQAAGEAARYGDEVFDSALRAKIISGMVSDGKGNLHFVKRDLNS